MSRTDSPLIVGAGPAGLAAALFLTLQGRAPRVVEMRQETSPHSKALAVNPRSLELLEGSGVAGRILELGKPIRGAYFHRRGRIIAALSFAGIHPRYPFLIALSQATVERLLVRALEAAGGAVERGVRMVDCRNAADGVEVSLESSARPPADGAAAPAQAVRCPWLLAADGARSAARRQLGIDFPGSSFASDWHLADAPLRTAAEDDHAHVFFLDGGEFQFQIRVVDDARDPAGDPLWRVLGNRPDPLSRLVDAEQTGPPAWTSSFRVSHRLNAALASGAVYFAGDAGHVHSPVGARGMNLGLEDAWVFAQLAGRGELYRYEALRRPVDRQVVRRVERLSRIASGEAAVHRLLRAFALPRATRIPAVRTAMLETLTGLDHDLPDLVAGAR